MRSQNIGYTLKRVLAFKMGRPAMAPDALFKHTIFDKIAMYMYKHIFGSNDEIASYTFKARS